MNAGLIAKAFDTKKSLKLIATIYKYVPNFDKRVSPNQQLVTKESIDTWIDTNGERKRFDEIIAETNRGRTS